MRWLIRIGVLLVVLVGLSAGRVLPGRAGYWVGGLLLGAGAAFLYARMRDVSIRQVADIGRMVDEFSSFARMPTPQMQFADIAEAAKRVTVLVRCNR